MYGPELNRKLDVDAEILVTQGANQGIALAMQTFIEPGDEVILIEPFFDIYKPAIEVCGGKVVSVPLRLTKAFVNRISANDWTLNIDELESKITSKTKGLMLNNPHNPTGKVFTMDELGEIAHVAKKHNLVIFSDDVVISQMHLVRRYPPLIV